MKSQTDNLPKHIEDVILRCFATISDLDVLNFFFYRPGVSFSSSMISSSLFLSDTLSEKCISRLLKFEFISKEGDYYCLNQDCAEFQNGLMFELVEIYNSKKPQIIELMFERT